VAGREARVKESESGVKERELLVAGREARVKESESGVKKQEDDLKRWERNLRNDLTGLEKWSADLSEFRSELIEWARSLGQKEYELEEDLSRLSGRLAQDSPRFPTTEVYSRGGNTSSDFRSIDGQRDQLPPLIPEARRRGSSGDYLELTELSSEVQSYAPLYSNITRRDYRWQRG
jgi:chromosome segregation ATPase